MKTVNVVATIIKKDNKIFATQRGYGEFKDGCDIEEDDTRNHDYYDKIYNYLLSCGIKEI